MIDRQRTLLAAAGAIAGLLVLSATGASAQDKAFKLFKVITAKDEVVIGVTDDELRSFGPHGDIDNLADRLVAAGQITAWQYAVTRAADGGTVQAPLRRVAIFKTDTLRIEPFNPAPLKALSPDAAKPQ